MPFFIERPSRTVGERVRELGGGCLSVVGRFIGSVFLMLLVTLPFESRWDPRSFALITYGTWLAILALLFRRQVAGALSVFSQRNPSTRRAPESLEEPPGPEDLVVGALLSDEMTAQDAVLTLDRGLRNRHVYAIGKTRTGKTSMLKNFIVQDLEAGHGLAFIDPHGDAALELIGCVPRDRIEDVIYFDPTSNDAPPFNPLALPFAPPKLTEDIISVFRMLMGESWGPRMEHLLRFGILTLLADSRPHTLPDLKTLYLNQQYRARIIEHVHNQQIVAFWDDEWPRMPNAAAAPILNKLSAFLAPMSDLERVFSQPANTLDFSAILNGGKVLIVNLAKGKIGDEPSRLLGGLIVACIQQAALARAELAADRRRDFYLYVDEFQNFTVASFESILAESAKYRLNLTLANQTLGQIPTSLQRSIFGNCATLICFQVSAEDAPALRREMHLSEIVVRRKGTTDFQSLQEFAVSERRLLAAAAGDRYLGMPYRERRDWRQMNLLQSGRATEVLFDRSAEIRKRLRLLDSMPDVAALREVFRDYEFRARAFPDVDDFITLPPRHAFVRVGTADNVGVIQTLPQREPDPNTARAVHEHTKLLAASVIPPAPSPSEIDCPQGSEDPWF